MSTPTGPVRPIRLLDNPLRRLTLDPAGGDAPLRWELLPTRDEAARAALQPAFLATVEALSRVASPALLRPVPDPDLPLTFRTADPRGVPFPRLLAAARHPSARIAHRLWADVARLADALHREGLALGTLDPAHLVLTPEGAVLPQAGWLPFLREAVGPGVGPASAEWLQLYPEPRLATPALLDGQPPSPLADRQLLVALLGVLANPTGGFPGGSAMAWYARVRRGETWPAWGRDLDAERVRELLVDPSVPLAQAIAALPDADAPLPSEVQERGEPWSADLVARGALPPGLAAVDPSRVDVSQLLSRRRARHPRRRALYTALWLALVAGLGLLAVATAQRHGACGAAVPSPPADEQPNNIQ